jgi:hypothetical protein
MSDYQPPSGGALNSSFTDFTGDNTTNRLINVGQVPRIFVIINKTNGSTDGGIFFTDGSGFSMTAGVSGGWGGSCHTDKIIDGTSINVGEIFNYWGKCNINLQTYRIVVLY